MKTSTTIPSLDHTAVSLPYDVRATLNNELEPGERVEWMDQPIATRRARATISTVLFGIPWTAFSIFWMWGAARGSVLSSMFGSLEKPCATSSAASTPTAAATSSSRGVERRTAMATRASSRKDSSPCAR
jgi:hypothetical protein